MMFISTAARLLWVRAYSIGRGGSRPLQHAVAEASEAARQHGRRLLMAQVPDRGQDKAGAVGQAVADGRQRLRRRQPTQRDDTIDLLDIVCTSVLLDLACQSQEPDLIQRHWRRYPPPFPIS
jgi:hypothetical protein